MSWCTMGGEISGVATGFSNGLTFLTFYGLCMVLHVRYLGVCLQPVWSSVVYSRHILCIAGIFFLVGGRWCSRWPGDGLTTSKPWEKTNMSQLTILSHTLLRASDSVRSKIFSNSAMQHLWKAYAPYGLWLAIAGGCRAPQVPGDIWWHLATPKLVESSAKAVSCCCRFVAKEASYWVDWCPLPKVHLTFYCRWSSKIFQKKIHGKLNLGLWQSKVDFRAFLGPGVT